MALKGIVTSDLVKTGQVKDYTEATKKAEGETQKLLDWFKQLSLKSPYELTQVRAAFKTNANNGETVAAAEKTTEGCNAPWGICFFYTSFIYGGTMLIFAL